MTVIYFLQALMTKLESEKANILKDIEQGKRLQQERSAPAFISQTVEDLERKWHDTNQLAQAKHSKLKVCSTTYFHAVCMLCVILFWWRRNYSR